MELSKRLYAVAGLVTEGASVADIGTDHGYVPIYLVEQGIASKVIAMDINEGPLERARIHIASYGFSGQIETRLSDGLKKIIPGEIDTMIAAGMGGGLVIKILEEGKEVVRTLSSCILQPQSEIEKVRQYLCGHGMQIVAEDMVEEDGKYYPMMKTAKGADCDCEPYEEWEYLYGKRLLENRHPVLLSYLKREIRIRQGILEQLKEQNPSEKVTRRKEELEHEILCAEHALACYRVE